MAAASVVPPEKRQAGQVRLEGISSPSEGTGTVYYYPTGSELPAAKIGFRAKAWDRTGIVPFAWKLIVPEYMSHRPTIVVVANRDVWVAGEQEVPLNELGNDEPWLQVIRLQSRTAVPEPDSADFLYQQLVRPPYQWVEGMLPEELEPTTIEYGRGGGVIILEKSPPPTAFAAIAAPRPDGVEFIDDRGAWKYSLSVPQDRPAAFAYEIYVPDHVRRERARGSASMGHPGFHLRVIRTKDVRVDTWMTVDRDISHPRIQIEEAVVDEIDQVPMQGESLPETGYPFAPYAFQEKEIRFSRRMVNDFNMMIGMIPIVGSVYDIAQYIYAQKTGRDFYKWAVSEDELAWMGVGAILGFLDFVPAAGAVGKKMLQAIGKAGVKEIPKAVAPEVANALRSLGKADAETLGEALERYAAGKATLVDLMTALGDLFQARMARQLDETLLRRVFAPDYSGFAHAELDELYRAYLSRKGGGALDVLQWAKKTSGRSRQLLGSLLGEDFVKSINDALVHKRILVVTPGDVQAYQAFLKKNGGIGAHVDLVDIKAGHGHVFESDHLIEQRFTRHTTLNPGEQHALIVPRNRHVAAQMQGQGHRFYYVHSEKTARLAKLIPHGQEHMFSVQQWWEAHVRVYRDLGLPDAIIKNELRFDFRHIADDLDEAVDTAVRKRPDSYFRKENGWRPRDPEAPATQQAGSSTSAPATMPNAATP